MPWWGWLIAVLAIMFCVTSVACVSIMTRVMRKATEDHTAWRATRFRGRNGIDGPRSTAR